MCRLFLKFYGAVMGSELFSTDKIYIALFASVLAAFITAAVSIVKLVNDKEGKTTDYRQSWNDSVRRALAEIVATADLLSKTIAHSKHLSHILSNIEKREEASQGSYKPDLKRHLIDELDSSKALGRGLWNDLYKSFALARLHFKPFDESFVPIEDKVKYILETLNEYSKKSVKYSRLMTPQMSKTIAECSNDIALYSRNILKTEWEIVKRGEHAYKVTKRISMYFCAGAILMLVLILFKIVASSNRPVCSECGSDTSGVYSQTVNVYSSCQKEQREFQRKPSHVSRKGVVKCDE